jgi:hypothetical protein
MTRAPKGGPSASAVERPSNPSAQPRRSRATPRRPVISRRILCVTTPSVPRTRPRGAAHMVSPFTNMVSPFTNMGAPFTNMRAPLAVRTQPPRAPADRGL